MRLDQLSHIVIAVGIPIILYLLFNIVRRVRAIRDLDARLRAEEAQTIRNPYADMAAITQSRGKKEG